MKKKHIIILSISVVLLIVVCALGVVKMFDMQYNLQTGVSSYINICIDQSRPREEIGKLGDYTVFAEGLDVEKCYVITISAKTIPLKEAISDGLVSVDDWKRKAWRTKKDSDAQILIYENYEIVLAYDTCIIRPITG